jgi:hypothetical protein
VSILWGKDRDLDYWAALQADEVPDAEKRAMILLASMSDDRRFSFYCLSGMFPAMGDVTKRIYLVRRWTTVLELEDGRPRASWCILAQDRQIAPESDHVIAMKNLLEGSELHFREVGNAFHYSEDPFRGRVDPKASFPNPYYNQIGPDIGPTFRMEDTAMDSMQPPRVRVDYVPEGRVPVERIWNEDSALQFRELENWIKTLKLKAELPTAADFAEGRRQAVRSAAAFRPQLLRDALIKRAKDWIRIPPKDRYRLPATSFERLADRAMGAMNNIGAAYGLGAGHAQPGFIGTTANTAQVTFTNASFGNTGAFMGPYVNATIA